MGPSRHSHFTVPPETESFQSKIVVMQSKQQSDNMSLVAGKQILMRLNSSVGLINKCTGLLGKSKYPEKVHAFL